MKNKWCSKCKEYKPTSDFNKNKRRESGYGDHCRECRAQYRKIPSVRLRNIKYQRKWTKRQNPDKVAMWWNSYKKWAEDRPWWKSFNHAMQRCNNPKATGYKYYGGRGIKCLMTLEDFEGLWFRDKAYLMKKPSIDRINSDKDYTKENCRFIEMRENKRRRSSKSLEGE